jgi:tRNA threonylcarbamoyl adenosine modification protein (Sua5/YciO/YrdC/YwlC family)
VEYIQVHPKNPQPRLITLAVNALREGAVIVYPTDSAYAIGCHIGDVDAVRRLRILRGLEEKHLLTLVCADLSQIANYARVDNTAYRILKRATPGPFTFVLRATREVPKRLQTPKRYEIGLRVPANNVAHALLAELGEAILSATLIPAGETEPLHEPDDILSRTWNGLDMFIDAGACPNDATTIIHLSETGEAEILRRGAGDPAAIGL